jgi:hypothetical protein
VCRTERTPFSENTIKKSPSREIAPKDVTLPETSIDVIHLSNNKLSSSSVHRRAAKYLHLVGHFDVGRPACSADAAGPRGEWHHMY